MSFEIIDEQPSMGELGIRGELLLSAHALYETTPPAARWMDFKWASPKGTFSPNLALHANFTDPSSGTQALIEDATFTLDPGGDWEEELSITTKPWSNLERLGGAADFRDAFRQPFRDSPELRLCFQSLLNNSRIRQMYQLGKFSSTQNANLSSPMEDKLAIKEPIRIINNRKIDPTGTIAVRK